MLSTEEIIITAMSICATVCICLCICVKGHKSQLKAISSETSLRTMVEDI